MHAPRLLYSGRYCFKESVEYFSRILTLKLLGDVIYDPRVKFWLERSDGVLVFLQNLLLIIDSENSLKIYMFYRNEYKLGNKVLLTVQSTGSSPGQSKFAPVAQYLTRRNEVAYRGETATLYCIYGGT